MILIKTSLIILLCIAVVFCAPFDSDKMKEIRKLPEVHGEKFYYFGFGSNMLTKRIHIQNPTAVKIGPGKLEVSWRKIEKSGGKRGFGNIGFCLSFLVLWQFLSLKSKDIDYWRFTNIDK